MPELVPGRNLGPGGVGASCKAKSAFGWACGSLSISVGRRGQFDPLFTFRGRGHWAMPANLFAYCYGLCYTCAPVALSHTPSDWVGCASAGLTAHGSRFARSGEPLNSTGPYPD